MRTLQEDVIGLVTCILVAIICGALGVTVGMDISKHQIIKAEKGYYLPVQAYGWQQTTIMGDIYYKQGHIVARVDK